MFPARAGMSPTATSPQTWAASVPRASGDEPAEHPHAAVKNGCSPRERG